MKTIVISDCDGVLTDGKFVYTAEGKVAKTYGPHDNDGVKLLKKNNIEVLFISADRRGFSITSKRVTDMKCEILNVSEQDRMKYIKHYIDNYDNVYFIGDGIHDAEVKSTYKDDVIFIAPQNARKEAKAIADYVTESEGGNGAFLDAALYIKERQDELEGLVEAGDNFISDYCQYKEVSVTDPGIENIKYEIKQ